MSAQPTIEVVDAKARNALIKQDLSRLDFLFVPSKHFSSAADAPSPSDFVCHLRLRGGRAPFVALRHFPRFIGDIYPFHRESLPKRGRRGRFIFYSITVFPYFSDGFAVFIFAFFYVSSILSLQTYFPLLLCVLTHSVSKYSICPFKDLKSFSAHFVSSANSSSLILSGTCFFFPSPISIETSRIYYGLSVAVAAEYHQKI